ncbi:ArsR/SmtB family transcription factor [Melghirimyces profundicolus]|uniref:ArsR/SmtB family transcription factor n=1 Tax=Melghirimyces profundicolus TaxID=1242148 RepID=UPI003CCBAC51
MLSEKEELNLSGLSKHFPMSRPAVSKHLRILSDAGLVSERKVGRETRYKLQPEALIELKRWLSYWENRVAALKHLVENEGENNISPGGFKRNEQEPKE